MINSLFDLTGKNALITGSSQGIGFTLAEGLARHGAHVILNGRNKKKLTKASETLQKKGLSVSHCLFDVTDTVLLKSRIAEVLKEKPIHILVNNAGIQFRATLEQFSEEKWNEIFQTNVTSCFLLSKEIAKAMIIAREGKIINISSVQSELARPGIAPYTASKGAIRNLTKGMATDWAKYGLQINAIAPGYFKTPLNQDLFNDPVFSEWLKMRTPAGRWGLTEELVGITVFLAGNASSFVNGQTIYVDGGITASI